MEESIRYLFNSHGDWIASLVGDTVFSAQGKWIGFIAPGDYEVFTTSGVYMGSIVQASRFYYLEEHIQETCPVPEKPTHTPDYAGFPGHEEPQNLPYGAEDVNL